MANHRQLLGKHGEDAAVRWYEARRWRIADRIFRCKFGEIDVIAVRGSVAVFCEVKTRSSGRFGEPAEAVDWRRQGRLRRAAVHWLNLQDVHYQQVRFDVAAVRDDVVTVIEAAF